MIIFINGSFGIGKTTVARLLRARLPSSVVFDPEPVGLVLQFLSRWLPLKGRHTDDFQDLALWRRACVWGIRLSRCLRMRVIVPMTFSNVSYLHEVIAGVEPGEPNVLHVCLMAPWSVVEQRIKARADAVGVAPSPWTLRRAEECCLAHQSAEFAVHIETGTRTPSEVAAEVVALSGALSDKALQPTNGAPLVSVSTARWASSLEASQGDSNVSRDFGRASLLFVLRSSRGRGAQPDL